MKRYVAFFLMVLVSGFGGINAQTQVNTDTTKIIIDKSKAKKPKLTKEEKKRLKELDAVVKTAKRKLTKEEKDRINRLTLLEIDLQNWLKDHQTDWNCIGLIEVRLPPSEGEGLNDDTVYGELWIKKGATLQTKLFFRGLEYEGQRWDTLIKDEWYRWRTKDHTLIPIYYNIPKDIGIDDHLSHPEYKQYNPWQELIEMEKKDGKLTNAETELIEKKFNKLMKEREKQKAKAEKQK